MKKTRRDFWLMVLLTLMGTLLRIADLTGRSMWLDEGFTLTRLRGDLWQILTNVVVVQGMTTIDLHPPLYFVLLKAWDVLLGNSEFALKLVSAFAAVLLIPATFVLARRVFNRQIAFAAVLIALLSPSYQYYGHELRMYTLVPLFAALSSYAVYRVVQREIGRTRYVMAYVGLTLISLLTHYALLGLTVAQLIFVLAVVLKRRSRSKLLGAKYLAVIAAFVVIGGALVVLIVGITANSGENLDAAAHVSKLIAGQTYLQNIGRLPAIVADFFNSALFGMNASDPSRGVMTVYVIVICLAGLFLPNKYISFNTQPRHFLSARLLMGLCIVTPMILLFLAAVALDRWTTFRYLIGAVPLFHLLLAYLASLAFGVVRRGLNRIRPTLIELAFAIAIAVTLILAMAAQVHGLISTFSRSAEWQDDWRGVAQYIRDNWRPGDVIILDAYGTPEDVLVYYLRDLPITIKPISEFLNKTSTPRSTLNQYERVWFANTGGHRIDPATETGKLLLPLYSHSPVEFSGQTNILQMILFETKSPVVQKVPDTARLIAPDEATTQQPYMAAYALDPANPYNRYPNLRLTIYWRRPFGDRPLTDYSLALRLKTNDNRTWADWFMPAQLGDAPKEWERGNLLRVDYIALIPMGLPRQQYQLELALGRGEKAEVVQMITQPLNLADVDCCVRLARWPLTWITQHDEMVWQASDVIVNRVEYPEYVMPGDLLPVILTWKLKQPAVADWQTQLSLDGLLSGRVTESLSATGTNEEPISRWPVGESMRSMQALVVPYTIRPGTYRLSTSRVYSDGHTTDNVLLGLVEVKEYPRTPIISKVQQRVSGKAGELELLGYSLDEPFTRTQTLRFTLFWRVAAAPARDGVLFLHVMGPDGKPVAQDDNPPEQGKRSTLNYRADEGIQQMYRLAIPSDAPGGEYRLLAGVYNRSDGVRWPAQQNGAAAPDDLLLLGTLSLPELPYYPFKAYVPMVSLEK